VEALFADIFVALDSAEHWSRNAPSTLRTRRIPHHSTAAKAKRGYLAYHPLGVIAIISS
jgi:acyl-CoA reductase-like NAD-dependent aldehyde dehydrogenase